LGWPRPPCRSNKPCAVWPAQCRRLLSNLREWFVAQSRGCGKNVRSKKPYFARAVFFFSAGCFTVEDAARRLVGLQIVPPYVFKQLLDPWKKKKSPEGLMVEFDEDWQPAKPICCPPFSTPKIPSRIPQPREVPASASIAPVKKPSRPAFLPAKEEVLSLRSSSQGCSYKEIAAIYINSHR